MKLFKIYPNIKLKDESLSKNAHIAYLLAKTMIPALNEFVDYKENKRNEIYKLQEEISNLDSKVENCNNVISQHNQEMIKLRTQINALKTQIKEYIKLPWKCILIRWIWFLFKGKKWKRNLRRLLDRLNKIKIDFNNHKDEKKNIENEKEKYQDEIKEIEADINKREDAYNSLPEVPRVIKGVCELEIPIFPIKVRKRKIIDNGIEKLEQEIFTFIDLFSKEKELNIPKIEVEWDKIISELNYIESFRTNDILIIPEENEKDNWGDIQQLIGKEKRLYESIKALKEMIKKIKIIKCNLPIISNSDALGELLQENIDVIETENYELSEGKIDEELIDIYKRYTESEELINNFLNEEFQNIIMLDNRIQMVKREVKEIYEKTKKLREESSEILSTYLKNMSLYSDLVSNYYFCPKCNVTKKYMSEKLGFEFEDIGFFDKLPTIKLKDIALNFLQTEIFMDNIGIRMSKNEKENILDSWKQAFEELFNIEDEILELQSKIRTANSNVFKLALHREIKTKRNLYRNIVNDLLKNHRSVWKSDKMYVEPGEDMSLDLFKNPKEHFNRNTKLKYKISENIWECQFCNTKFSYEEAKLGSVHKIEYDLEYPVLNTLWNDENVWGKLLDLHRDISREHRDRLAQEAESIQGRIDQFLADSRQIRRTVQEKIAQSSAATKRVKNIESKFSKFELLDSKTIEELHNIAIQNSKKLKEAENLLEVMSGKENELRKLPKQIALETQIAFVEYIRKETKQIENKS